MFSGEDSVRFKTTESYAEIRQRLEEALSRLGDVEVEKSGRVAIHSHRFSVPMSTIRFDGWWEQRQRDDEYNVSISYKLEPSAGAWVLGILFLFPLGLLFLLVLPLMTKGQIDEALRRSLDEVRDAF